MADDLDNVEDMDFDSDFGEQLDDFMESDIGGDDGGENDSELDSFFEDLSTIDDLEVKETQEEPAAMEEVAEETAFEEPDDEPAPPPAEPKDEKPIMIPAIISTVAGIVTAIIVLLVIWLVTREPEPEPPPTTLPSSTFPMTTMPQAPQPVQTVFVSTTFRVTTTTLPPPPEVKQRYFVQVANCIYQECIDDYRYLLKKHGHAARIFEVKEKTPMTEIVSRQTLGMESASNWVGRINTENHMAGRAFSKKAGDRFWVSLGLFPDLETANRVKTHLNQLYAAQIIFEARTAHQSIHYYKIRTGGFDDRNKAEQLKQLLMELDPRFKDSFIAAVVE